MTPPFSTASGDSQCAPASAGQATPRSAHSTLASLAALALPDDIEASSADHVTGQDVSHKEALRRKSSSRVFLATPPRCAVWPVILVV